MVDDCDDLFESGQDILSLLAGDSAAFGSSEPDEASNSKDKRHRDDSAFFPETFDETRKFPPCPKCPDGGAVHPGGGGSACVGEGALGSKHSYSCTVCDCQWQENNKRESERLNGERGIQFIKRARHGEKKRGHANQDIGGYKCSKCGQPKKGHICSMKVQKSNDSLITMPSSALIPSLPPLVPAAQFTQDVSYKKAVTDLKCFSPESYYAFKVFNNVLNQNNLVSSQENNTYIFNNGNFDLQKNKVSTDTSLKCESSTLNDILFMILQNENFSMVVSPIYNLPFPTASPPHPEFTAFFNGRIPGIAKLHTTMEDAIQHSLTHTSIIGICETQNSMWASCHGHIVVDTNSIFKCSFVAARHTPIDKDNGERVLHCFCLDRIYSDKYRSCEMCHMVVDTTSTSKGKHNVKGFFCDHCNHKITRGKSLIPEMIECAECLKNGLTRLCHIQCVMDHKQVSKEALLSDSSLYKCPLHS